MNLFGPGRRDRAGPLPGDVLLTGVLGVFMLAGTRQAMHLQESRDPLDWLGYLLLALAVAPVLVRRVWPYPVFAATVAVTCAYIAAGYPYGPILFLPAITMYTAAWRGQLRSSLIGCALGTAAVLSTDLATTQHGTFEEFGYLAVSRAGLFVLPWVLGTFVRIRREYALREREDLARRRVDEERLMIAREVHDVVGHGLSVINMQAGIALHVLSRRPEQAAVALEAIKRASKDALEELRVTLAVFRQSDEPRAPAPGLGQLDALVAAMSRNGLPVELVVSGDPPELPSAVDHAAYRITQESLTNVLRHARATTATVRVSYQSTAVDIEITNSRRGDQDGTAGTTGGGTQGGGHGIVGMRERATGVGGTLEAGPLPGGGFRVHAHLPFGATES